MVTTIRLLGVFSGDEICLFLDESCYDMCHPSKLSRSKREGDVFVAEEIIVIFAQNKDIVNGLLAEMCFLSASPKSYLMERLSHDSQRILVISHTPLKILLTNATEIYAGGEEYVFTLARCLLMRGHSVLVSANPDHLLLRKCEESGIATLPIKYGRQSEVLSVCSTLRRLIREHSIDIIHSNSNYDRTCAAIAALLTPAEHIATVHSAHSIQFNPTHWLRNRFAVAHFIAVAEAVRDVLIGEDKIDSNIVTYIPNGVENSNEEFRREARVRVRSEWNIGSETIVVGNVARLVAFKGHAHLLKSIARVVQSEPNVFFPIFGDGELLNPLKQQAKELGIENYVRFFGFCENVNDFYPAFDVYCHSSIELAEEAFPLAILHALGTGIPVVSTKVGGIGSMVEDGKTGFLTPPEDPQSFAEALLILIRDGKLRHTMGNASLEAFMSRFHASLMAERVEEIYLNALQK